MNPYEYKACSELYTVDFFKSVNKFIRWVMIVMLAIYGLISLMHDTKVLIKDKDGYIHLFFEEDLKKYIKKINVEKKWITLLTLVNKNL